MLLFAPLYAPLLLALIPKRLRGLRIAVGVIGIACNVLMVCAAFYYGTLYRKNRRKGALIFRTGAGSRSLDDALAAEEDAWDRDSGVL